MACGIFGNLRHFFDALRLLFRFLFKVFGTVGEHLRLHIVDAVHAADEFVFLLELVNGILPIRILWQIFYLVPPARFRINADTDIIQYIDCQCPHLLMSLEMQYPVASDFEVAHFVDNGNLTRVLVSSDTMGKHGVVGAK